MNKFFVLLTFLALPSSTHADHLILRDALTLAIHNDPGLRSADLETRARGYTEKKDLAGYMPKLTLSLSHTLTPTFKTSTSARIDQTIFRADGPAAHAAISRKYKELSELDKELKEDQLRLKTETAFIAAWLKQEERNLVKAKLKSARHVCELAKGKFDLGMSHKSDWLTSKSAHQKTIAEVNEYNNALATKIANLEAYTGSLLIERKKCENGIGFERYPLIDFDPKANIELADLNSYLEVSLKNRKDIIAKSIEAKRQQLTENLYHKGNLPRASFTGTAEKPLNVSHSTDTIYSAGIAVTWNVFDQLSNHFDASAAKARTTKAILEKEKIIRTAKSEVTAVHRTLGATLRTLHEKKHEVTAAQSAFELAQSKFELGMLSAADFTTAEKTWQTTNFAWLTLAAEAHTEYSELMSVCGYP